MKRVVGYGWSGLWDEANTGGAQLGWMVSQFVSQYPEPLSIAQRKALGLIKSTEFAASDMYRVKITIEAVKDKRGRCIVKRAKRF